MHKINLLPWRLEVRKIQNRIFFALLVAVIFIAIVFITIVHCMIAQKIFIEEINVAYLESEKNQLKGKEETLYQLKESKKTLLKQVQVSQELQNDRVTNSKLLDVLARLVPEGIYLLELTRHDQLNPNNTVAEDENIFLRQHLFEIIGVAQSNASITVFLKNIENEKWFSDIKLSEVLRDKNGRDLSFKINFQHNIMKLNKK